MRARKTILYTLLYLSYMGYALYEFPKLGVTACIPVFFVITVGAWLYGRHKGLLLTLLSIPFQHLLTSHLYADQLDIYQYPFGYIMLIILCVLAGTLKDQLTAIQTLNTYLDSTVASRNRELQTLSAGLLDQSEHFRNGVGQKLHDEIGQELTGIQLFISALSEQIKNENITPPEQLQILASRSSEVHGFIRQAARSLFPIRLNTIGLKSAMEELISYILKIYPLNISLSYKNHNEFSLTSQELHFYRIAQETLLFLLKNSNPTMIEIQVSIGNTFSMLEVAHNGNPIEEYMHSASEMRLIHYRLNELNGTALTVKDDHMERIRYNFKTHIEAIAGEK